MPGQGEKWWGKCDEPKECRIWGRFRLSEEPLCEDSRNGREDENWRGVSKVVKVLGSSKRRWTEGDMDGADEVNGERGDVRHPFTAGLDFMEDL
jgi:hypothetical protein